MIMTTLQKQFFALAQSGLWGADADPSLFDEHTDWKSLYRYGQKQTLLGVLFDGIQTLPAEKQPPRQLYLQWCNSVLQIEDYNRLLNRELANVYALYRANGIEPVLLKGQGVAQNYRNPLHRQCGDVDLYVGKKYYTLVNNLLSEEATNAREENYTHTNITWHGISVENHRILSSLSSPAAHRHFKKEIARWHSTKTFRNLEIGECKASVPPLTFDTAYILVHSVLHFLNEGIGLRQICDWACLLHAQREHIDRQEVKKLLRKWKLTKAARIFGVIAVNYLGLPAEDLPLDYTVKDLKSGEWLLNDIWQGGNFGKHDPNRKQRPKGYWRSKWFTFTRASKRCLELRTLVPAEAHWYPVKLALRSAQMQWRRLCGKTYRQGATQ